MRKLVKKLLVKGWGFEVSKKQSDIPEEDLCECCKKRKKGDGLRKLCIICFENEREGEEEQQIKIKQKWH